MITVRSYEEPVTDSSQPEEHAQQLSVLSHEPSIVMSEPMYHYKNINNKSIKLPPDPSIATRSIRTVGHSHVQLMTSTWLRESELQQQQRAREALQALNELPSGTIDEDTLRRSHAELLEVLEKFDRCKLQHLHGE